MIKFYKTIDNKITTIDEYQEDCWINVINPTLDEVDYLIKSFNIEQDFIRASLDEEESSRIDMEDDQTLFIVDVPIAQASEKGERTVQYYTLPMGIIIMKKCVVTICTMENSIVMEMANGFIKNADTAYKTRFLLLLLLRTAVKYLQCLRQIQKISSVTESQLHRMMKNKELIQLLDLQKALVYFSTSLKADEVTIQKIYRGRVIKMYEEDQDLLEDVLVEIKQAIEMASINSVILSSSMEAFGSIISNNLNIVMKALTSITILMAIPDIISGIYGMNVSGLPLDQAWFPLSLIAVSVVVATIILISKGMFK